MLYIYGPPEDAMGIYLYDHPTADKPAQKEQLQNEQKQLQAMANHLFDSKDEVSRMDAQLARHYAVLVAAMLEKL